MVFSTRIFERSNFEKSIDFDVVWVVMYTIMESEVYDHEWMCTIPSENLWSSLRVHDHWRNEYDHSRKVYYHLLNIYNLLFESIRSSLIVYVQQNDRSVLGSHIFSHDRTLYVWPEFSKSRILKSRSILMFDFDIFWCSRCLELQCVGNDSNWSIKTQFPDTAGVLPCTTSP